MEDIAQHTGFKLLNRGIISAAPAAATGLEPIGAGHSPEGMHQTVPLITGEAALSHRLPDGLNCPAII